MFRDRGRLVGLGLAGLALVVLFGSALPTAGAAARAETKLTIAPWQKGVFGYLKSSKPGRCAQGRPVAVWKSNGERVATTTAKRRRGRYQWSIKTKSKRGLVAKAKRIQGCGAARSASIPPTAAGEVPDCPSNQTVCHFPNMHGDMVEFAICPGFTHASGSCSGSSEGGVSPWAPDDIASFGWQGSADGRRDAWFYSYWSPDDEHSAIAARLYGSVPGPGSADWSISTATAEHGPADTKDTKWFTPNVPGAAAGTQGGPLYLDFENGSWGFDIYVRGYLYRK
jgi:hypothetical protein